MKTNALNRILAWCTAVFVVSGTAGCDSDTTEPEIQKVEHVSILVSLDDVTLDVGESVTILASPVTDEGEPRILKLVWESTDDDVAAVTGPGVIMAVGPGFAQVQVRALSHTPNQIVGREEVRVHVLENAASVSIEPAGPVEMVPGDTLSLTATVRSEAGEVLAREVMWYQDDMAVASVDDQGTVTALAAGTAMVTAEVCDGVTASIRVIVKKP